MPPSHSVSGAPARLALSVGVFAHDEAASILASLESVLASRSDCVEIAEVLVVSSGSRDGTDEAVQELGRREPLVRLMRQSRKEGKASAVNLFLSAAKEAHCVLVNADTILHEDALEALCAPLRDPAVGIVGGHPVPVATARGLLGYAQGLFWEIHHRLCLRAPKMGELVAFRRVLHELPLPLAGADEDWIHGELVRRGLRAAYAPGAIVYNRVPATLREFMAHRRRMAVQHLVLRHRCGFTPASRRLGLVLGATLGHLRSHPWEAPRLLAVAALELGARAWAAESYYLAAETCRDWAPLRSSKGITQNDVRHSRGQAGVAAEGEPATATR